MFQLKFKLLIITIEINIKAGIQLHNNDVEIIFNEIININSNINIIGIKIEIKI
jgi:hypothetical protein